MLSSEAATPDSKSSGPAPQSADDFDFDKLVADVVNNPELVRTAELTSEQLLELHRRIKPYASIGGAPEDEKADFKRIVAASFTNLRERYIQRMTMTSLVAFIFQVYHEWAVPPAQRTWLPAVEVKADRPDSTTAPFVADRLVERLEATLGIAKEAQAAAAAAAAAKAAVAEDDAVGAPAAPGAAEAARAAAAELAARAAGLLYAATHVAHRVGADASARLRATALAGMAFPAVKEIIARAPLPPPPGQVVIPPEVAKEIIGGFLRNWFTFDPSIHVRSGHSAAAIAAAVASARVGDGADAVDTEDPGHLTLDAVLAAPPAPTCATQMAALETILGTKQARDAVIELLRDGDLADAALTAVSHAGQFRQYLLPLQAVAPDHQLAIETITKTPQARAAIETLLQDENLTDAALVAVQNAADFQQYLLPVRPGDPARAAAERVPPQDTFHRWGYFTEVNYESLRTITEALYPERADLDWALGLWEMFQGTPKEVDAAFDQHCQRYQDQCVSSISAVGDFKENRSKIQFYNKHTEVLKRILDRHTDDKKMGAELMRKRVYTEKAANVAAEGGDAPGLAKYKREIASKGQDLGSKGVEKVITPEQMRRLEKAKGSIKAAQELELLEQHEETVRRLTELKALRPLSLDEKDDLKFAIDDLPRVREMLAVPDNAIQIDVFSSNPATGAFGKSHIYTEAVAPEHLAKARAEHAAAAGASGHPVAAGTALPAFAPYAVDHIVQESKGRSAAEQRADAVRDADAAAALRGEH
jgi:hypothetical protein